MEIQLIDRLQAWGAFRESNRLAASRGFPYRVQDMDLLNDSRSLIHTGKLYRQPEGGIGRSDWTELFVILFDNYCTWLLSLILPVD